MTWTRRELLEWGTRLGLLSALPISAAACVEPEGEDPWPPFEGCDPTTASWSWDGPTGPEGLFSHGVASGDPLADSVILWTRVSPDGDDDDVEVFWEVADSPDFGSVVASAVTTTSSDRDFTVKVDADCLRPGRTYYYRFQAQGRISPIGRTRTATYGVTPRLRFAIASCSNWPFGYFHGYQAIGEMQDLDFVCHLGDYIYEYADGEYGDFRGSDPAHEIITLDDYRRRHALYKTSPGLQEAHRQHPFICTWDDHETANNSWSGGAQNHGPGEGDWEARKEAGRQAYFEYLPIREGNEGRLYRQIVFGDLVDLLVLDTRIEGRDEQGSGADDAYDPDRQLLGATQESWLLDRLANSISRWKMLGQQVVMGQWSLAEDDEGRPLPLNSDSWDGYQAARARLFDTIVDNEIDGVVVLTGDVHSSWAIDLTTNFPGYTVAGHEGSVAVEAVTPGITSPGTSAAELLGGAPFIRFVNGELRGFVVLDVTPDRVHADWHLLDDGAIEIEAYQAPTVGASWRCNWGEPWWVEANGPLSPIGDAPDPAP